MNKKQNPVEVISMGGASTRSDKVYKECAVCHQTQSIDKFFTNKNNVKGTCRDKYCKECARKMVTDEKSIRKYIFENNRQWKPEMWTEAMQGATHDINLSQMSENMTDEERIAAIEKRAARQCLRLMNEPRYYKFVNNDNVSFNYNIDAHIAADQETRRISEDPYYSTPIFSTEWNGMYTQAEIDHMGQYLGNIIQARGVEDDIAMDYARKFVIGSALVDRFASEMRDDPSKETFGRYKDALGALEITSKAAQIAPAYKKDSSTVGLGSLGEFIKAMENARLLDECPEFPPDQIDGIIKDFRHTMSSVQGSGGLWSE